MLSNFSLKSLIIFYCLIFIVSCSQDENNPYDPDNHPPEIVIFSASPSILYVGETTNLTCRAIDEDNDILNYSWSAFEGTFPKGISGSLVDWKAPEKVGDFVVEATVSDYQESVVDTIMISVVDEPCDGITTITHEGLTYNIVQIGKQCWMKENLNVGTMINDSVEMSNQDTLEKYCYDNLESNCDAYGGLYQLREVMQYTTDEGAKGICPDGWHLPTFAELQELKLSVDGNGNSLKSIGQGNGLGAGNNTSGFSGLLAGLRSEDTNFGNLSDYGLFWSSSNDKFSNDAAYYMYLNSGDNSILFDRGIVLTGISARCLKD